MKNILLPFLTAAAMSFGVPAFAGDNCDGDKKAKHFEHSGKHFDRDHKNPLKHMSKTLELTEQQETQIKALFDEAHAERKANKPEKTANLAQLDPNAADYSTQVAALAEQRAEQAKQGVLARAELQQKINAILTPEQQHKMLEMKAKRKDRRAELDS
ncbi:MAG: Spy/CpxP family protein refolding chaperone [Marinagarivorans sp.]|nr:Spy/CpxP family protein refolding chaperone [Marinagarivorans sp.]